MLSLQYIYFSFQLGVFAYVVTCILTQQDYLLSFWDDFLASLENKNANWKRMTYPLGRCEKCFGGQAALWVWLHFNSGLYALDWFYALVQHSLFISFTIVFTLVIKKLLQKWK